MINITLSPVRVDAELSIVINGETIIVNGEAFDFSPLLEGATLPGSAILSDWFPGDAERKNGDLSVTIRLPHGANAPENTRFPAPLEIKANGPVELPPFDEPEVFADE